MVAYKKEIDLESESEDSAEEREMVQKTIKQKLKGFFRKRIVNRESSDEGDSTSEFNSDSSHTSDLPRSP